MLNCESKKFEDAIQIKREYYPNGVLRLYVELKNGIPHGLTQLYYENGQVNLIFSMVNGKQHGLGMSYLEDGFLLETSTYKEDKLNGPTDIFFPDINTHIKRIYKEGTIISEHCSWKGKPVSFKELTDFIINESNNKHTNN